MSAKVMGMVFDAGPAEATQRFVLLAIADNCDDGGFAFPGVDLLAQKSCQTERNVLRILQALEVGGWMTIKRRSWGAKKRGNTYQLNMARLRKSAGKAPDSSHDKLSPDAAQPHDSIERLEPPHDKLSPDARGDKNAVDEVTNSSSRGDIRGVPFNVFNRQEPSTEPTTTPLPPSSARGECGDCDLVDGKRRCTMNCGPAIVPPSENAKLPWQRSACAAVQLVKRECGWSDERLDPVIEKALRERCRDAGATDLLVCAGHMFVGWKAYLKNKHLLRYPIGEKKFITRGWWLDDRTWPWNEERLREKRRL